MHNLLRFIKSVIAGDAIYGGNVILPVITAAFLCAIFSALRDKKITPKQLIPIGMLCSAFSVNIAIGGYLPIRSMVSLPLLIAGLCGFISMVLASIKHSKWLDVCLAAICGCVILFQMQAVAKLSFSHYNASYRESVLAAKIADRIERKTDKELNDLTVVMLGQWHPSVDNEVILQSPTYNDLLASSFFSLAGNSLQGWKYHFMKYLGYSYNHPSEFQISKGEIEAYAMPVWPHKDSVKSLEG
ncbi:hypothetical protein AGMMS49957_18090 [Synergistales bacterium]|nr:hypothetical protein AGMMS49957_18090 [Synergistales bacterium]